MSKTDVIARRVLGWKLNSVNTWFDRENKVFVEDFQPEKNMEHALLIVDRLEKFGFTYEVKGDYEVYFNHVSGTGNTLAEAITNAAYALAEVNTIHDAWL
ncbi:hypothetical protein ACERII_05835 [Evansella sp. AB-rgal1]|uniref:BC1872 family protein n=1 Tax=Evansella sp. AB-rgal1 TaxID=3242696 RepID=UPI00359DE6CA